MWKYNCLALRLFLGAFIFLSCQTDGEQEGEEVLQLTEMSRKIECQMEALQAQSEKLWDKTNSALEKALPDDVEAYEKSNMLKVRNADLIRMFESYNKLGDPIKAKVDLAEKMDFAMADSMRVLQEKQKQLIDSARTLLMGLPSDEQRNVMKEKMKHIQNTACTKIEDYD